MYYSIASSLGIPVYILMSEMPYDELQKWIQYYAKRPKGWEDDLRAYHIIRSFGAEKRKPEEIFPSLVPIVSETKSKSLKDSLKGSSMLKFIRKATKGDKLSILDEL